MIGGRTDVATASKISPRAEGWSRRGSHNTRACIHASPRYSTQSVPNRFPLPHRCPVGGAGAAAGAGLAVVVVELPPGRVPLLGLAAGNAVPPPSRTPVPREGWAPVAVAGWPGPFDR